MDDIVTVQELAEMLSTTPKGVYHRRNAGQLPSNWYRLGRHVVWPRETIAEFMLHGDGPRLKAINELYRRGRNLATTQDD